MQRIGEEVREYVVDPVPALVVPGAKQVHTLPALRLNGELPGALAGFRAFRYEGGKLWSMTANHSNSRFEWSTETNEASCTVHEDGEERLVPISGCGCGVWAYKDFDNLLREPMIFPPPPIPHHAPYALGARGSRAVLALIAGWGKIVEHEAGFRSRYMRPLAFIEVTAPRLRVFPSHSDLCSEDENGDGDLREVHRFTAPQLSMPVIEPPEIHSFIDDHRLSISWLAKPPYIA